MLFDDEPSGKLVGIARLAATSEVLEAKQRVQYFELETRRFIGRNSNSRMSFVWTVNPYRGCEFGCKYCYARYAHEFMELREPELFETKIYAKQFHAPSFRAELKRVKRGECIWIGTATDPYQPAERRFRITRRMLEVLASQRGLDFGITTKSDLVARDAELLGQISKRNAVRVNLTITTLDDALARLLEPRAPRPGLRLGAVKKLTERRCRGGSSGASGDAVDQRQRGKPGQNLRSRGPKWCVLLQRRSAIPEAVRPTSLLSIPRTAFPASRAPLSGAVREKRVSARALSGND